MATACAAAAGLRIDPAEHLRLVWMVAGDMENRRFARGELLGPGYDGLCAACRDFDAGREVKFSTYAVQRIRWAMLAAIRRDARAIYVPEWATRAVRGGMTPEAPGLTTERRRYLAAATGALGRFPAGANRYREEDVPDPEEPGAGPEDVEGPEPYLGAPVESLPPPLAELVRRRFGLDGYPAETSAEVARALGVSRQAVGRREAKALAALRAAMGLPPRGRVARRNYARPRRAVGGAP